jgi:phosphoethanolamine N-methyltransferase
MTSETREYDDAMVALLDAVWGEGYMSPGGPDEIRMIVEGVALSGMTVLDLGCGTGGITRFCGNLPSARIVGIDVDAGLVARATKRSRGRFGGLSFRVTPGRCPCRRQFRRRLQ